MADLMTVPYDGHGPEDTCPGCPHAPRPMSALTPAERIRRFLDEYARPMPFAPEGFLPVDWIATITRTGDTLLVSDLRAVLDALDAATDRERRAEARGAVQALREAADHWANYEFVEVAWLAARADQITTQAGDPT